MKVGARDGARQSHLALFQTHLAGSEVELEWHGRCAALAGCLRERRQGVSRVVLGGRHKQGAWSEAEGENSMCGAKVRSRSSQCMQDV